MKKSTRSTPGFLVELVGLRVHQFSTPIPRGFHVVCLLGNVTGTTVSMRRWPKVGLLLGQRRRRWASCSPTLGQRIMSAGTVPKSELIS